MPEPEPEPEPELEPEPEPSAMMAAKVAAALGWEVDPGAIELEDTSGRGAARTYRVISAPGQRPVALHLREAAELASTNRRLQAVCTLFAERGLTPRRLHDAGEWYVEEWGGTTLLAPWDDVPPEGPGRAASTPAELGALLAKVHRVPTDWFDEIRAEYCEAMPALREAGPTNLVWIWHTCNSPQAADHWATAWGVSKELLTDCRANIDHFSELLVTTLGLSPERIAEWVRCGEGRMQWRSPAAAKPITSHGDFWMHNIVRGDDDGLKVIDLEFAGVLPAGADVAYALWHFEADGVSTSKVLADCLAFVRSYLAELGEDASDASAEDFVLDGVCWMRGAMLLLRDLAAPSGAPLVDAFEDLVRPGSLSEGLRREIIDCAGLMRENPIGREAKKVLATAKSE